jgi:uncharacterized protein
MFIGLKQLELGSVRFAVDVPAGQIEFDNQVTQASALHAEGRAELLSALIGEIRVQGKLGVTMNAPCDRCLETALVTVDNTFDLIYMPADQEALGGENEVEKGAVDVGFYEGNGLQLNDVLREVVLLAMPMQLVCSAECKGICPECGQNRNHGDCGCRPAARDDRWSKLKQFLPEAGLPQ